MNCNFCGGNLSLEEEVCPHCGRINRDAAQHIRDMKRYHGEFQEAKEDVYTTTKRYSELSARAILLAILIALIFLCALAEHFYFRISNGIREGIAEANAESYSAVMDAYIEREEYIDLQMFASEKEIDTYEGAYEKYRLVLRAADTYSDLYMMIMGLYEAEEEEAVEKAKMLADQMEFFYKAVHPEQDSWLAESYSKEDEKVLQNMEKNVQLLLRTYCGLTEEEAEDMATLSTARRAILLEEGVGRNE